MITPVDYYSLNNPSDLLAAFGSNYLDAPRVVYSVAAFIQHPGYRNAINDIGLIRLLEDIEFNQNIQPIALPTTDRNYDGYSFLVTGWGRLWVNLNNLSKFNKHNFYFKSYRNVDFSFILF